MKRIFIVDDDPHLGEHLSRKLTELGYQIALCHSSKNALSEARRFDAELILLDVMLGDGLGYDVARAVRRDPLLYKVPVLFESAIGDEHEVVHAFSQGGDAYLCKPYTLNQVREKVDSMRQLRDKIQQRCPLTNFHSLSALRREVDHRLFRNENFALCYIFLKGLRHYYAAHFTDKIHKIAVLTGEAIRGTIENDGFYETYTCHMGGGYFMVLVNQDDYPRFRSCLKTRFSLRAAVGVPQLGEALVAQAHEGGANGKGAEVSVKTAPEQSKGASRFGLMVGVTHTGRRKYTHAQQMFDVLQKAEDLTKRQEKKHEKVKGHNHWV